MSTSLLAISALGFFLGMRHATDPDHVVAISTIVARQRSVKSAAIIGGVWGLGHTITILVVGGAIVLFTWVVPPMIGLSMELSVGVMLIVLGIMNLSGIRGAVRHTTAPKRASESHRPLAWLDRRLGGVPAYQLVRPLVVGVVHGLAGSAALALLVLTTIGSSAWSLLYLLVFGVGTIIGMMLITAAIGIPFASTGKHSVRLNNRLRVAAGLLSLGFGLFLAYQIGFGNGLFTGQPHWTPR